MSSALLYTGSIVLFLYAVTAVLRIIFSEASDFSVFYYSARNILEGVNIYRDHTLFTGFGYPPFTLLPYIPLTYLPYKIAQAIWITGSLTLIPFISYLSLRIMRISPNQKVVLFLTALSIASFPFRFTLGIGQPNIIALFFLLFTLLHIQKNTIAAGLPGLVLVGIIKPHLLLLLAPLSTQKKLWKFIVAFMGFFIGIVGITIAAFGFEHYVEYCTHTAPELLLFRGRSIYYNQGLSGLVSRMLPGGEIAGFIYIILSILILFISLRIAVVRNWNPVHAVIRFIPVFLLVEPLAWQHHFIFLLPVCVDLYIRIKKRYRIVLLFFASILLVSFNIRDTGIIPDMLAPLILSHGTIGLMIIWFLTYIIL